MPGGLDSGGTIPQTNIPPFHHFYFPPIYIGATNPSCKAGSESQGKYINILARNYSVMGRPLPLSRVLVALICIRRSDPGLPWVNLIIYKDDLRMMASQPVAAQEGGMKDYGEGCIDFVER